MAHNYCMKARVLSSVLARAGNVKIKGADGTLIARKRLVSELLWQLVTTGRTTFADGTEMLLCTRDWMDLVKWLYNQVDGPIKAAVEISTPRGRPLEVKTTDGTIDYVAQVFGVLANAGIFPAQLDNPGDAEDDEVYPALPDPDASSLSAA